MERLSAIRLRFLEAIQHEAIWHLGITVLVCSTLLIVIFRTAADPDLWGHLRFGLDTIRSGQITRADPYSYVTSGQRWVNHEWLAEVLFALSWNLDGSLGLILLKVFIALITMGVLYWFMRKVNQIPLIQTLFILLLGALPLIPFLFHIRPQLFSYLFFVFILLIVYKAEHGEYRWIYAAPPVMALWANFHGGVLAGLGIFCLWAALHLLFNRQKRWHLFLVCVASIAATLLNPYGVDLLTFLFRTATVPRPEIEDWQPLALVSALGFMYLFILACAATGIALSTHEKKPVILFLFGLMALLPWLAMRHLPLFSLAAVVLAGEHIASAWTKIWPPQRQEKQLPLWLSGFPFVASAIILAGGTKLDLGHIHLLEKGNPPVAAVALLKQSGVSGNLATEFDWGEYIIWHLGPSIKVSIDGRRETIYSQDVYRQNIQFMFGVAAWDAVLTEYPTDMALVYKLAPDDNLLKLQPGWILVFEDAQSSLYARRDSRLAQQLEETARKFLPPGADQYFP